MRLSLPNLLLFICVVIVSGYGRAQTIVTVAGGIGNDTFAAPYGRLSQPSMIVPDGMGGLYVRDGIGGLRKINMTTNVITTVSTPGGKGMFDAAGNWFYISSNRVYKKDAAGTVTLVAGNGLTSYVSDGVAATLAAMNPVDVVVDAVGNLYIADGSNHRVRKVNTSGIVSTYAGTGTAGYSGDGGNAMLAMLNTPTGITMDAGGNLYIADMINRRIRKVNTTGIISTYAGTGAAGSAGDGGLATAATLLAPSVIRMDAAGNLYMVGGANHKIRMVNTTGVISTIAGDGIAGYTGDGFPATTARLNNPVDIAFDASDGVFVADRDNNCIRYVNGGGMMSTFAGNGLPASGFGGDGGNALLGVFNGIGGFSVSDGGEVYIADYGNHRIRKIDAAGMLSSIAGNGLSSYLGNGGPATAASVGKPVRAVSDKFGNVYVASDGNNTIRKISSSGVITLFAGGGSGTADGIAATAANIGQPAWLSVDTAGNVYTVEEFGQRKVRKIDAVTGIITTFAGNGSSFPPGDGGPATAAALDLPNSVAFDRKGNAYIGGFTLRKVNAGGIISAIPGRGESIAVDTMGNVYYIDGSSLVKRYDIYGYTSVIANVSPASSIAIDTNNYLYFANANTLKKMGPLSTVIDYPPTFTKGVSTTVTVCVSSAGNNIDTFLKVKDNDMGQTLTWSLLYGPTHGTVSGFPASGTTTGGIVPPSGITYTPDVAYAGSDAIRVRVSDGEDTAVIDVTIIITATASAGSITGLPKVCKGATIELDASVWGGTWSSTGSKVAVDDTGLVTGIIAGVDTVIYTVNTYCGIRTVTKTVTVNQITVPEIVEPLPAFCVGSLRDVFDYGVPNSGDWSIAEGPLQVIAGSMIRGTATGTGMIVYSVTNECGIGRDTVTVMVEDKPQTGTVTGLTTGCPGDVGLFTSTVAGGKWYSSNVTVASIDSVAGNISLNAAGTTQITYRTINVCGISNASKTVTVPSAPNAGSISGSGTLCAGSSTTLTNTVAGGIWSAGDTLVASIDNAGIVNAKQAGVVAISYTVTNGCGTGSAVAMLNVNPVPEVTPIAGKSVVITGSTVTLKGRAPVGLWSSSDTSIATINAWGELTGVANGTTTITYSETNGYNCSAMETLQVVVTPSTNIVLAVYPIPANRVLNVAYQKSATAAADVQFTDMLGRVTGRGKIDMPSSAGVAQFDVSLLPAGVYTISVLSSDGNYIGRFVVAH